MRSVAVLLALGAGVSALPGCAQKQPAPFAEALVVVDTDLPVPALAGRLRVDLYSDDGNWYESRDIGRPEVTDWPATFSVFSPDQAREARVVVRLRAYPEGIVRDYRGERYSDIDGVPADGATRDDVEPRLRRDGRDITPTSEPKPTATVDRLVVLLLTPGVRGRARVTLRGACAGTMALLGHAPPYQKLVPWEAETCIDTEGVREHPTETTLEADMSVPPAAELGKFPKREGCDESARGQDPRAECIPGNAFLMGSFVAGGINPPFLAVPERIQIIDRFWLDRTEVSVGQMRAAIADGFRPPQTIPVHEAALGKVAGNELYDLDVWCTYSAKPRGREDLPLTCADWSVASAYCQFVGGDLPSEAQWEYAATTAGKSIKSQFPWGDETPTCDRSVYDRTGIAGAPLCKQYPGGPVSVGTMPLDVTPAGILDMGGNVAELLRDDMATFSSPCWITAPLANPVCVAPDSVSHALRGASFVFGSFAAQGAMRNDTSGILSARAGMGFRCAFAEAPGRP